MKTQNYSRLCARFLIALAAALPLDLHAQRESFKEQVRERVAALVNELRTQHGARPLEREARLEEAAGYLADYMARTDRLDHRADGTSPRERVKQRGYAYCDVSENIAVEYSSRGFTIEGLARNFIRGWHDSPTHRANMLDPIVTQTGLGVARSARGEYFVAQVFARPMTPGTAGRATCPR